MIRLVPRRVHTWTHRLRRLSASDVVHLVGAFSVTLGMWTALRLVAVRRVLAWTEVPTSKKTRIPDPQQERLLWAVASVNRRLFPDRPCLTQALAARYLLARRGVSSTFRIGVSRGTDQSLQAHAWLEQDGEVLIGGRESPEAYQLLRGAESLDGETPDPFNPPIPESLRPRTGSSR